MGRAAGMFEFRIAQRLNIDFLRISSARFQPLSPYPPNANNHCIAWSGKRQLLRCQRQWMGTFTDVCVITPPIFSYSARRFAQYFFHLIRQCEIWVIFLFFFMPYTKYLWISFGSMELRAVPWGWLASVITKVERVKRESEMKSMAVIRFWSKIDFGGKRIKVKKCWENSFLPFKSLSRSESKSE